MLRAKVPWPAAKGDALNVTLLAMGKTNSYCTMSVGLFLEPVKWYRSFRSVLEFKVVPHSTTECSNVTIASSAKNGIQIHTDEASYVETQNGKLTVLNVDGLSS